MKKRKKTWHRLTCARCGKEFNASRVWEVCFNCKDAKRVDDLLEKKRIYDMMKEMDERKKAGQRELAALRERRGY